MDGAVRSGERAAARGARRAVRRGGRSRRALVLAALLVAAAGRRRRSGRAATPSVLALVPRAGLPGAGLRGAQRPRLRGHLRSTRAATASRSRVFEYDARGTLLRSWTIRARTCRKRRTACRSRPATRAAGSCCSTSSPARALLLDPRQRPFSAPTRPSPTWRPACRSRPGRTARRPSSDRDPHGRTTRPGGRAAALYVTDYLQAVIWRVPPGGGGAKVWLADRRLDGGEFGTTGIALARRPADAADRPAELGRAGRAATRPPARSTRSPIQPTARPGAHAPALGEPPGRRARRLRARALRPDLRGADRPATRSRWSRPRAARSSASRAQPPAATTARRSLRQPVERDVPRHAADRRQPELHRRPRPTRRCSTSRSASAARRS